MLKYKYEGGDPMVKRISSMKNLSKFVMFSILVILLYTITEFVVSVVTGIHHPELTQCVYNFFGVEIAACGFIKIFKIIKG